MSIAHKIQLKPTKAQESYFRQACGTSRLVYNWGLSEWVTQYKAGLKPSGLSLKKQFNEIKYQQFPWLKDIHRDAHAKPFTNLQQAFNKFFKKKSAFPKFKKKGKCKDSFYVANDKFHVAEDRIKLPVIGSIKMTEELRFEGKIESATVSRTADRWFVSIIVDAPVMVKPKTGNKVLGLDVGVKASVTTSDGQVFQSPKPLRKKIKKLKRLSRQLSKKVKGSSNRFKASVRLAKLHWRITNARNDFLHKTTTSICRQSQTVCLESLSVKGMMANHKLARCVSDESFAKFSSMMEYKSVPYGVTLVFADRFFPSSKTCSNCGSIKKDLKLSDRVYKCGSCGFELDRDFNAALNLQKLCTAGYAGTHARGQSTNLEALRPTGTG